MLVNRLSLVVIFRVKNAIVPSDGLRGFIGLEPQIPLLVSFRKIRLAQAGVTKHEVVMRLQILGIDGQNLLKFLNRICVAALQK